MNADIGVKHIHKVSDTAILQYLDMKTWLYMYIVKLYVYLTQTNINSG